MSADAAVREYPAIVTPERVTSPTPRVPLSPTPRQIRPHDGQTSSGTGDDEWRERGDFKRTLTSRYLEDQANVEDDGFVPASDLDSEDDDVDEGRERRARAAQRALEFSDGVEDEPTIRLIGMAVSGECLEVISRTKFGAKSTLKWQRVNPYGGSELIEGARGIRYVCQDDDVGCILRVVHYDADLQMSQWAMTNVAVSAASLPKERQEGKRREIVLPELQLGPTSEAHQLYLQGKMLEASAQEHMYDSELSDEKSKEALRCYVLAAKERYVPAYASIGRLYELGIGVKIDYEQARGWYKEGVKEGCAVCNNNFGSLEYLELGIGADRELAPKYFMAAVAKGNAAAMNNLAVCYEEGVGVPQNFRLAKKYYEQAVRGGIMSAFTALGYAGIVNGELDDALDAFHAGLESGTFGAAKGIELLSTVQSTPKPVSTVEKSVHDTTVELLKIEISQYADLSTKLYDLIMSSNDATLKRQAQQLTQLSFATS